LIVIFLALVAIAGRAAAAEASPAQLELRFHSTVQPFLQTYCVKCHGQDETKADLNLTYPSMAAVLKNSDRLADVLDKLDSEEMPPAKAKLHPPAPTRREAVNWFAAVLADENRRHAGDPGPVLARRLSNAEYDYTIRDLTGRDLRPTREFPVDPTNIAGFDNSGESLVMSPALLNKYLAAARDVANHLYLKPAGFAFAPHPMLVETDRDKLCVQQIIDVYHRHNTDYADYFQAAWRFKNRAALGLRHASLADFAAQQKVSEKYLATLWSVLEGRREKVGPLAKLQALWRALPKPAANQPGIARAGCEQMRGYVTQVRKKVEPRFLNLTAGKIGAARQPLLIWKNVQYATHRRTFDPAQLQVAGETVVAQPAIVELDTANQFGPGATVLVKNAPGDPDLAVPAGQRARYEAAFARFCSVFPDMFYKEERGRNYFDASKDRGRYLSAGFHNVMGYFRDDQPLYELILDEAQQKELDGLWHELDFVAAANIRTYVQFSNSREARGNLALDGEEKATDFARAEDREITSESRLRQLETRYLKLAEGGSNVALQAIRDYFTTMNASLRWVEKAHVEAEPGHLAALLEFATRAYRRPLAPDESADILAFYRSCREKDGLDHETAIRESVVSVLMSPDLTYRLDLAEKGPGIHPLSDYDLASRLSYFLWSSLPDAELLAHAAAGDLHQPKVIAAQARRMLKDPRIRALAVEFGGNWLDFRRFEELGTVDHDRFPSFTPELRTAMFEEPVRLLMDVIQNDRSVLDLVYGDYTFANPVLARHYGLPVIAGPADDWVRVAEAGKYGRGGLLPMAVFLTKNAPGLRTSPVKRGNWVVKNVLGERIPAPPPVVPELPRDEAKLELPLREMLARHRADPNCAACHARFDSMGLVFEGFGPVGERREKDLGGRPVDAHATFPGGGDGEGLEGLRRYIREKRQHDFVSNLSGKLLAYALGRSRILSDGPLVKDMETQLATHDYRFGNLIEKIVTSRQFLTKRGSDFLAATEVQP